MHRVELGPVIVALMSSRSHPTKVLEVYSQTQVIALAPGSPSIKPQNWDASPLWQSRSIGLWTLMGANVDKVGNLHCRSGPIIRAQKDFAERKMRAFDDLCNAKWAKMYCLMTTVSVVSREE
ncbi:hypothetical protein BJV77DRAFT_1154796 [Russula vinacea]|nr:hypothetical protein BJV77DRAFT_1154796 [Russula vinacea]